MADNSSRTLPALPSAIFIVLPILGITSLLIWATIQNRRGYGVMRHLEQLQHLEEQANVTKPLSTDKVPELYEIWLQKDPEDTPEYLSDTKLVPDMDGHVGHGPSFLVQRPLALLPVTPVTLSNALERNTLATFIRMPAKTSATEHQRIYRSGLEFLIGTSYVQVSTTRDSSH